MKKKKIKFVILFILCVAIVSTITFFIGRQIGLNTDTSSTITTITEEKVSTRTIKKTLTSSGEIQSIGTEKLQLSTSLYFETMCVEEGDSVLEGENILKYSDGTYLVAPYNCVISSYSVPETGNLGTSSNYVEIYDLINLKLSLNVSEGEISKLNLGQEVNVILTADSTKTYTGVISKIDAVGTYQSSGTTYPVTVTFINDGFCKIGMSVSCEIVIEELKDIIAVPINSVKTTDDSKYVVVVDNGTTKNVTIETGLSDDEYVQVVSGLTGGETVQIVTTTTESTIRSTSNSEKDSLKSAGGRGNSDQMPSGMNLNNENMKGDFSEKSSMSGN